jgi:FdhD protein
MDDGRYARIKQLGTALLAGVDLSGCALTTSGRLSGVMVAKAARDGFPVLVSRSAPMNSGVELAEKIGTTLVAFARTRTCMCTRAREG